MHSMKKIITIAFVMALLLPVGAGAEAISYKEAWAFLYDFPLSWDGSVLAPAQRYSLTTGDVPVLPSGNWMLTLYDGKGRQLAQHRFDPAVLAAGGLGNLIVPYFDNGTTARFTDAAGKTLFEVDLRGSRVCDDNDFCASGYGEDQETCPSDCGSTVQITTAFGTAAIAEQVAIGQRLGFWILRLSLGAAGILLLLGAAQLLDSRRGT